jgi:hypothetical protein
MVLQWEGINRKQSTRWQHLSRLKASAFFSSQKNFSCYETQQLILGTGTAIWWVIEPHCTVITFVNYDRKTFIVQATELITAIRDRCGHITSEI